MINLGVLINIMLSSTENCCDIYGSLDILGDECTIRFSKDFKFRLRLVTSVTRTCITVAVAPYELAATNKSVTSLKIVASYRSSSLGQDHGSSSKQPVHYPSAFYFILNRNDHGQS